MAHIGLERVAILTEKGASCITQEVRGGVLRKVCLSFREKNIYGLNDGLVLPKVS